MSELTTTPKIKYKLVLWPIGQVPTITSILIDEGTAPPQKLTLPNGVVFEALRHSKSGVPIYTQIPAKEVIGQNKESLEEIIRQQLELIEALEELTGRQANQIGALTQRIKELESEQ